MIAVAATPRVRDRLRAAPDGTVPVVHAGRQAVYVDVGGWCVGVVAAGAARVPCAMRTTVAELEDFPGGRMTAYLQGGTLRLGGRDLPIRRLVDARAPRVDSEVVVLSTTSSVTVQATPPATVAEFVARHVPHRGVDADVAGELIGRGPGLTPLGDDVLAGWLAMHRAVGITSDDVDDVVRMRRSRTTLLSATLLDCALHGEVLPEYAGWLRALGTTDEPARVRALHRVGATSGAGLHVGGRLALDQLAELAGAAA